MAEPRTSVFRSIAENVHAALVTILTAEERFIPDFVYGRQYIEGDQKVVRIQWSHTLGSYVFDPPTGAVAPAVDPPIPPPTPICLMRAQAYIWITSPYEEDLEHLLMRLPLATQRSDYDRFFHWRLAHYELPSERAGVPLQNGVHVGRIQVPVDLQVNGEADGESVLVTVIADKLRAAITTDLASDPDDETEWQPEQWAG